MANNFWDQFEAIDDSNNENTFWDHLSAQNPVKPKWGNTVISATPKRNIMTDFADCLKWVNNTRVAAHQEGKNQDEVANLEIKDMLGLATTKDKARLNELNSLQQSTFGIPEARKYIDKNETNFIPRMADTISTGAKKGYVEALKMIPYMWETIKAGGIGTGVGAGAGALVGTGVGLATTKANTPALALQGARIGGVWGGRLSGSMKLAELESGLARIELKQINQEIENSGGEPLSNAEINALAIGVGAVNAGLELVSLKQMLKTVPNGDKILEFFEKRNLRELAVNKSVRAQLSGVIPQYAKTIGTEMTTEMAQEITNIVASETARKFGGIENTPLEQNVARVLETGKATFGATLYLGGIGSAAKVATIMSNTALLYAAGKIMSKQGLTRIQAKQAAEKMTKAEQEEFIANNLDTLIDSVNDIPSVQERDIINKIKNTYFTQNLNAGLEKEEALAAADIQSNAVSSLAKNIGMDKNELNREIAINTQSLTAEQAS